MLTNRERFAVAKEKALKAIDDGDLEEAQKYQQEAQTLKDLIDAEEAMKSLELPETEPIRPPMPGEGAGALPEPPPDDGDKPVDPFIKSFFVSRFREPAVIEHTVLKDLHGVDYMQKYWNNRQAFLKYVRYGFDGRTWTQDEANALKEIILTPEAVKTALWRGFDSVATLKATMIESQETVGGFIVPIDFQARIIERLQGLTVVRPLATVVATSRDKIEYPVATGGGSQYANAVRVTWVDEQPTSTAAETNLTYGMENVPIYTCMASTPISKNLLEDAAYPIEQHLIRSFGSALAINEDNKFLTGDGTNAPQGVLQGTSNGLGLSYGSNGSGGSTDTIDWDGLISTMYAIDSQYRQNARWVGEKATYEVIAKLKDSNGQYLWRERFGNNVGEGMQQQLMGFPALEQESLPTVTTNAFPLIFGDFQGYTIADRVGMSIQRYDDSTTATQNYVKFVMRRRLGGKVTEPWRFVLMKCATS